MNSEGSSQYCPEYNALVDNTSDLCKALPIDDLFSDLISQRVIEFDDKEELCNENTSKKKVEKFLEKYLRPELLVGEKKRFQKFMCVMKCSAKCDFLVERMEERITFYYSNVSPGEFSSFKNF